MTFAARLAAVRARIAAACNACGRDPAAIELVAVSKNHGADAVRAALAAGQRAFGENRVQELTAKAAELADARAQWHMVGSLQTNKVADLLAVEGLVLLHSLDRKKLADALQTRLAGSDAARLTCLLEVNASGDANKHGVTPRDAGALLDHVERDCPALRVQGVMAMGPLVGDARPVFTVVARLREELAQHLGRPLPVLSLGMSDDLETALTAGSTMLRIGTALFGPRG